MTGPRAAGTRDNRHRGALTWQERIRDLAQWGLAGAGWPGQRLARGGLHRTGPFAPVFSEVIPALPFAAIQGPLPGRKELPCPTRL